MLDNIRLQRFRSYRDDSFEFGSGVNIIVGPNAIGKTNLLEAILVVSRGSSFRAKDSEIIAFGADWARLDTSESGATRSVKFLPQDSGAVKKEFIIKDQKLSRLSLQKTIPTVLFEPNHLRLLHGSPENRRDYLDDLLEQITPGYAGLRRDYRRTLAQRNALLKKGHSAKGQIFAWDFRLSEIGARIATERTKITQKINQDLPKLYRDISLSETASIKLKYAASCNIDQYASSLLKALEKRQDIDIERGYTGLGPHREDLLLEFNGRPASEVASRGEIRTILLALKIIELRIIEEARGVKPTLLLDDVFSELDGSRRKALTEVIAGYQTFITTTDADVVVHHFMDNCHIIPLS